MAYPAQVEALVQKGWLWQGQELPAHKAEQQFLSSGWAELDARLGGGWLQGSVNELQVQQPFIGELALLLPLLAKPQTTALWVNPPVQPYAPGLSYQHLELHQQVVVQEPDEKLALWAAEQALQSNAIDAVLLWHASLSATAVRRLQQAAEAQQKLAFVITPWQQQEEARAYVTRLQLERADSLSIRILKRRFGWPLPAFPCGVDSRLPRRRRAL
ncbi:MAG: hypothetical protein B7X54_03555 [Idiomarina sp. 34-48-12]|nr:MAG: hypothetical protein B7X54_03555 [Idiomarina sp. 34-48-12]